MSNYSLCGVKLKRVDAPAAARWLTAALSDEHRQFCVFTPNIKILLQCKKDKELCRLINCADLLLPDGAGIGTLCHAHGMARNPRITGIDMGYFLLRFCASRSLPVYLLGGKRGVAERAARKLCAEIPDLKICGTHHGYFDKDRLCYQNNSVLDDIRRARPALLLVCFGFPEQERWIRTNLSSLPSVRLCMGLGGSLDVWAGDVRRAPMCMRLCNLEWLWRIIIKKFK